MNNQELRNAVQTVFEQKRIILFHQVDQFIRLIDYNGGYVFPAAITLAPTEQPS